MTPKTRVVLKRLLILFIIRHLRYSKINKLETHIYQRRLINCKIIKKKSKRENRFNPKIQIARRFLVSRTIHCCNSRIRGIEPATLALPRHTSWFWMKMRPKNWMTLTNCWKRSMEKNQLKIRNYLLVA